MRSSSLLCGHAAEAIYLQGALIAVLLAAGWAWTGYVRLCELRRQRALAQAPPGGGRADDEERLGRCTSPASLKERSCSESCPYTVLQEVFQELTAATHMLARSSACLGRRSAL